MTAHGGGDTAAGARSAARDRAATLRRSLSSVADERLRTVDRQVEHADEVWEPEREATYVAAERLEVDCRPSAAADVVVSVTDAGETVQGVQFHLDDGLRQRLEDDALTAAMERARQRADRIAGAEGHAVSDVLEVTTVPADSGPEGIVEAAMTSLPDDELSPSRITVSETVEVTYELDVE